MRAAWVLLLLLLLPASAQQLSSDPERSGSLSVQGEYWSVARTFNIHDSDFWTDQLLPLRYVPTESGAIGVAHMEGGQACFLLRLDAANPGEPANSTLMENCRGGWLQAHDPRSNTLYLCNIGPANVASLQARHDETGELLWDVKVSEFIPAVPDYQQIWTCSGSAFTDTTLVVPFIGTKSGADFVSHRIVKIDTRNQQVVWNRVLPSAAIPGTPAGLPNSDGMGGNFLPLSATLTSTGIVVPGLAMCANAMDCDEVGSEMEPFKAVVGWMNHNGEAQGFRMSQGDPLQSELSLSPSPNYHTAGSMWASAQDNLAHLVLGDRLLILDPSTEDAVLSIGLPQIEGSRQEIVGLYGPIQRGDFTVVPMVSNIVAIDPLQGTVRWSNPGPGGSWRVGTLHDDGHYLHALYGQPTSNEDVGQAFMEPFQYLLLDAVTGTTRQILPLGVKSYHAQDASIQIEGNGLASWTTMPQVVPLGDKLLVADAKGRGVLLEEVKPEPLHLSDPYPAPGQPITFEVPEGDQAYISWGDRGVEEKLPNKAVEHVYDTPGRREIVVTMSHGTTTTVYAAMVDVGGTPPANLNFMQTAFAEGNQDMTWGIIGIAGAILGATYGIMLRARRRGRMQTELDRLQEIRQLSVHAPLDAVQRLANFRTRMDHQLAAGKVDEGQYRLLTARASGIAQRLRERVLADSLERAGASLRGMVDAALLDGVVDGSELRMLEEALKRSPRLNAADKTLLRQFLTAWAG